MSDWVDVMALSDMPDARGLRLEIGEHRIALFKLDEESVYAIGDRCSHAEASLAEGEVFDYDVECPRHGSEFDVRTGVPASLPATRPVPTYETRISDGRVEIKMGGDA